jgi:hypothetical protein
MVEAGIEPASENRDAETSLCIVAFRFRVEAKDMPLDYPVRSMFHPPSAEYQLFTEMFHCERMTGAGFQVLFELPRQLYRIKCYVQLYFPGDIPRGIGAFPGVVIFETLPEVGSMADISFGRMREAFENIGIKHGRKVV